MGKEHAKQATATDTVAVTEWLEHRKAIAQLVQKVTLQTRG